MLTTFFAGLTGTSVSTLMLLAKATLILLVALGITLSMQQRASAGARHLVWLVTLAALLLAPALTAWAPIPIKVLPATAKTAQAAASLLAGATEYKAGKIDNAGTVTAP